MKFDVGDKIKIVKPFIRMGKNHLGEIGVVTDLRCYGGRHVGYQPTHYVVKFKCYKIPHIYMPCEIEDSCEIVKSEIMKLKADFSVIITMAGPVKFYTNLCPHGLQAFYGGIKKVGSTECQMCQHFVGKNQHLIEGTDLITEIVECNHEQ